MVESTSLGAAFAAAVGIKLKSFDDDDVHAKVTSFNPEMATEVKERKFLRWKKAISRCQCYKTFFSSLLTMRPNKLECLHLAKTFQSSLTFAGSIRSLPKKKASEGPPIGFALALPSNSKT